MALSDRIKRLEIRVKALEPIQPHKIIICNINETNDQALARLGIPEDHSTPRLFIRVIDYRKSHENK